MAGIASTLEADFSDFVTETKKANAAMAAMGSEATAVSSKMEGSAVVVGKFGGAASSSTSGVNTLSGSLKTADKTLGAFGVQIGSQISAIEEMEQVAGKTAGELGVLGTAISVAGAALAGWNIGRWIADMTGADKAISDWAATLMGLPSLSEQTAGAIQDVTDKAVKAGYAGTDYAGAIKFLTAASKENAAQFVSGAGLTAQWTGEIEKAKGGAASLKAEIEAGTMTTEQMSAKYRVSAEAIGFLTKQVREETKARNDGQAAIKAQGQAIDDLNEALRGQDALLAELTDSQRGSIEAALEAGASQATIAKAYGLTAGQVKAVADALKDAETAVKAFDAAQKITDAANADWNAEIMDRSGTTTSKLIADVEAWRVAQVEALDGTEGATQAMYDQIEAIAAEKLAKITVNWETLKQGTIATFADQAARAEATYQEMLAHSNAHTAGAIADAQRLRDETLATYDAMLVSHNALLSEQLTRQQAYQAAVTKFSDEAANAGAAAWQKEQAALDQAIAYANAYGTTIADAQVKLGQMGDTGEQAGQRTTAAMNEAGQSISQVTTLAQQSSAQLREMARFYQDMATQNMQAADGRTTIGWSPFQVGQNAQATADKLRAQAGKMANYENAGTPWARNSALTVTVNNADAQGIASKLVEELRHSGVRFG